MKVKIMRVNYINSYLPIKQNKAFDKAAYQRTVIAHNDADTVSFCASTNPHQLFDLLKKSLVGDNIQAIPEHLEQVKALYNDIKAKVPPIDEVLAEITKDLSEKGLTTKDIPKHYTLNSSGKVGEESFERHIYIDDEGKLSVRDTYSPNVYAEAVAANCDSEKWEEIHVYHTNQHSTVSQDGSIEVKSVMPMSKAKTIIKFAPEMYPVIIRRVAKGKDGKFTPSELTCNHLGNLTFNPNPESKVITFPGKKK